MTSKLEALGLQEYTAQYNAHLRLLGSMAPTWSVHDREAVAAYVTVVQRVMDNHPSAAPAAQELLRRLSEFTSVDYSADVVVGDGRVIVMPSLDGGPQVIDLVTMDTAPLSEIARAMVVTSISFSRVQEVCYAVHNVLPTLR